MSAQVKRKPIEGSTTRQWFMAHVLEDWRRWTGPLARKAYRAETDEQRIELMKELRLRFESYLRGIDSELGKP